MTSNTLFSPNSFFSNLQSGLFRFLGLLAFDVFILWLLSNAFGFGFISLGVVLTVVATVVNIIFLVQRLAPLRWMAVGLALMIIFVIYPMFFTVYVSFTNYGDGHLITKEQALEQILKRSYLPEEGKAYAWTAYISDTDEYALWLQDESGDGFLAVPGEEIVKVEPGTAGVNELDASGIPSSIEGYTRLNAILAATDQNLPNILFGVEGQTVQVRSPSEAAELVTLYEYDELSDSIYDIETGITYTNIDGTFTAPYGDDIKPGFRATVGWENFVRFLTSPALRGPLVRIISWNFIFPTISVLTTFSLGLAIAIMFNESDFPLKKIIRTLLLIPYTIPGLITIIIWRGMMNPELGVINRTLERLFGSDAQIPWTTEALWAQIAILLVNLWLGYPYMMLICSGALQTIPSDMYEAAQVNDANAWQQFRKITLPLLLVAVGPLLIASYIFNFNNFNLIYLFISGGPPIAGAATQAGHTDILISYVYKLAFEGGGRGVEYGLASAMSIVIFIVVGAMTLFQFRFTNMWEEVSENV
jgi:ABC-type sugar transport system permease subunit